MKWCFHKYKELGYQYLKTVSIIGAPISRMVFKCKKCGKIKMLYSQVGYNKDYDYMYNWTPEIFMGDTLSEIRKKKLKKINDKL